MIADVLTPRMTGPELTRHMQATRSDVRVLYVSGNTAGSPGPAEAARSDDFFLHKPFSPPELLQSVHKVLRPAEVPG